MKIQIKAAPRFLEALLEAIACGYPSVPRSRPWADAIQTLTFSEAPKAAVTAFKLLEEKRNGWGGLRGESRAILEGLVKQGMSALPPLPEGLPEGYPDAEGWGWSIRYYGGWGQIIPAFKTFTGDEITCFIEGVARPEVHLSTTCSRTAFRKIALHLMESGVEAIITAPDKQGDEWHNATPAGFLIALDALIEQKNALYNAEDAVRVAKTNAYFAEAELEALRACPEGYAYVPLSQVSPQDNQGFVGLLGTYVQASPEGVRKPENRHGYYVATKKYAEALLVKGALS